MAPHNHATLTEIITQTAAWEDAINVVNAKAAAIQQLDLSKYDQVMTVGCGSTYYLSLTAANMIQSLTGAFCRALPSSELLLFPDSYYGKGRVLLVAISRSGSTTETVNIVREFKQEKRGDVILISNYPDAPLVSVSDIVISINAGQEVSVAQTRSFSSMLVAVNAVAYLLGAGKSFDIF
jgi:glucosamine--fructose-6-phosphate aminotransferase (isomerizing)